MNRNHWLLVSALLCVVLYGFWVVWPHMGPVAVKNHAGLSEEELKELVMLVETQERGVPGRGELRTIVRTFFKPWFRPHYEIETYHHEGSIRLMAWGDFGMDYSVSRRDGRWWITPSGMMIRY